MFYNVKWRNYKSKSKGVLMSTIKHYHLIINELSGSGKGKKVSHQIGNLLMAQQISFTVHKSAYHGHTVELTKVLAHEIEEEHNLSQSIIVIGGDGTLHEVLTGLGEQYAHIPVGYIPAGSGNDFARGTGISKDPKKALKQILTAQQATKLDIIEYYDHNQQSTGFAVNNVGIGFDAAVVKRANHSPSKVFLNKLGLSSFVYFASLIQVFFKQSAFPLTITTNGDTTQFDDAFLVIINSHPYFGGGIPVSPKASQIDGKLDLIILPKHSFANLLYLFVLMIFGGKHLNHKNVYYYQAPSISLKTTSKIDSNADGEILVDQPIDFQLKTSSRYFWI